MPGHGGKRKDSGRKPVADVWMIGQWCQKRRRAKAYSELQQRLDEHLKRYGLQELWAILQEAPEPLRREFVLYLRAKKVGAEWNAPNKKTGEEVEALDDALNSVRHRLEGFPDSFFRDEIWSPPTAEAGAIVAEAGLDDANRTTGIGRRLQIDIHEWRGLREGIVRECVDWYRREHGKKISRSTVRTLWRQYEDIERELIGEDDES